VIDTTWFTGNYPERASIDATNVEGTRSAEWLAGSEVQWEPLLIETQLNGNTTNEFAIDGKRRVTHLRFNIFPDGGVARLRVYGEVIPANDYFTSIREIDLAAMESGGYVIECSDMHYGHRQNLILPGRSTHMGDGWETKRRRGPGNDWTIVRLAKRGIVERVEIDTDHFRGNAPGSAMLESADVTGRFDRDKVDWQPLVAESPLQPHSWHHFQSHSKSPATHVRLNIYPDGGVARLRLFGRAV
jgi:allantoicase